MKSGNREWKYWPSTKAPKPSRQASLDTTASGSDQSSQGISDTPLYKGMNFNHQATSFWAWTGIGTIPVSRVSRRKLRRRETKIQPGGTKQATNWSLLKRTCKSWLEAEMHPANPRKSSVISSSLSGVMVRDMSLVLFKYSDNWQRKLGHKLCPWLCKHRTQQSQNPNARRSHQPFPKLQPPWSHPNNFQQQCRGCGRCK